MGPLYMSLIDWIGLQRFIIRLDHGDGVTQLRRWLAALLALHQNKAYISHAAREKLHLQLHHVQVTRCSDTRVLASSQSPSTVTNCKASKLLTILQHP